MHIFSDRAGPQGLGRPPIGNTCWPRMLPHAQRDLHQSLPQKDQALDECFNLVPDECMAIENHRENRSFQLDSLHVHAIIKASLFSFLFSFLMITKILACIFWFLGFFAYCFIHPTLELREKHAVHLCGILPWITMIASCGRLTLHPVCYKAKRSCLVGEKE